VNRIEVFTDGGSRGNPGQSAVGVYIADENGKELVSIGKKIGIATNNVAEYSAIVEALEWLVKNKKKFDDTVQINFFLDSELAYSQLCGLYKVKNSAIRELIFIIRQKEAELDKPIAYSHIPREKNKKADLLVNLALDNLL
jgi:ribonuclease HI